MIKYFFISAVCVISLIFSYSVVTAIDESQFNYYLKEHWYPSASVLVGLSLAVSGIFMGSIFTVHEQLTKGKRVNELENLHKIVKELKENTIISLMGYLALFVLPVYKDVGIMYLDWPIWLSFAPRSIIINTMMVCSIVFLFIGLIDTALTAFKLYDIYHAVRGDETPIN